MTTKEHIQAEDVLLLVEIADTSLAYDVAPKRDLYARFSVSEYWVVALIGERILAHAARSTAPSNRWRSTGSATHFTPERCHRPKWGCGSYWAAELNAGSMHSVNRSQGYIEMNQRPVPASASGVSLCDGHCH